MTNADQATLLAKVPDNGDLIATINHTQSRTLATLRDTLLPKLLNGEVSVNKLNAAAL